MGAKQAISAKTVAELAKLREQVLEGAANNADAAQVDEANRLSANNMAQYLELRNHDVRQLQSQLAKAGLSSLGRVEPHVLASIDAVYLASAALNDQTHQELEENKLSFDLGNELLQLRTTELLGEPNGDRYTRIMVTLPSEAALDGALVERIIEAGAEVIRINCAHDDETAWLQMIDHVKVASKKLDRKVTITMDLAGPKLRTGQIELGEGVLKLRPTRNELGEVTASARAIITANPEEFTASDVAVVPVLDGKWINRLKPGSEIHFRDARGAHRELQVLEAKPNGVIVESNKTSYIVAGIELVASHHQTEVAAIGGTPKKVTLHVGDALILVPGEEPADLAQSPIRLGCSLPEAFRDAQVGQRIFFDDGMSAGIIEHASKEELHVRIIEAAPGGTKLAEAKGINLPDTNLDLPALTEDDLKNLPFIVEHADAVSLSFVRSPSDVLNLQEKLTALGGRDLGVILKIETVSGFKNLPKILFAAMRWPKNGVMIARGDLAVEAGYQRLAELQEEIMWLCEAAHIPVIWATQVLDTLGRTGHPSRAEVTDAAMSSRAECVMLNKGPYVDTAVAFLNRVLARMDEHQHKKQSLMRQLTSWD